MQTIYTELYNLLKNAGVGLVTSSFQDESKTDYTVIKQIASNLDTLTTCLTRLENNIYQIEYFGHVFSKVVGNLETVDTLINAHKFSLTNKNFCGTNLLSKNTEEVRSNFWRGNLQYEIITEQRYNNTGYQVSITEGTDIYNCLVNRFNGSSLATKVKDLVTSKYTDQNRPCIFIPNFTHIEDLIGTDNIRFNVLDFDLAFEHDDLNRAEDILNEIDLLYSYCQFRYGDGKNKRFLNFSWQGNTIEEIDRYVWLCNVNYQITQSN